MAVLRFTKLIFGQEVSAQAILPSSCIPRPFDNSDFNLNGVANFQPPGTFELTSTVGFQFGSLWYRRRLDLRVNFRLAFDVYLGNSDSPGADGMAFVLQNFDTGQGSAGGGLVIKELTHLLLSSLTPITMDRLLTQLHKVIMLLLYWMVMPL